MATSAIRPSAHPAVQQALSALPQAENLRPLLDQARCVSFDFFDTLFTRPFSEPEFAFDLLGRKLGLVNFRRNRVAAQQEAFRRMAANGRREIRLTDIYDCFDATAEQKAAWAAAEMELELALLAPKPEVLSLFLALQAAGMKLAICSDMYLPRAFFLTALAQQGMAPLDLLLVSAEEDATKRDAGELFRVLIEKSGVNPSDILHIGDHATADVMRAQESGLMAFHYDAPVCRPHERQAGVAVLHGLWHRCQQPTHDALFDRLGFIYGGAANLGYLRWLKAQCQADGIQHLLFLSRDGYLLEQLARQGRVEGLPPFHYFTGSRVAYYLAAITEQNFNEYIPFLLSGSEGLMPRELLERIGVTAPEPTVMQQIGLGDDFLIAPEHHALLAQFLSAWRPEILKICARNRRALRLYLAALGIQPNAKIGLVDVGWSGSTQEAFIAATRPWIELDVTGYYLVMANTEERKKRSNTQRMVGMYHSENFGLENLALLFNHRAIIELFFSAPHSTIIGWDILPKTNTTQPVMDTGRGGAPHTLQAISQRIIDSGLQFAECYAQMVERIGAELTAEELVLPLLHLAAQDTEQCRKISGQVINFDTWSSTRNQSNSLMCYI